MYINAFNCLLSLAHCGKLYDVQIRPIYQTVPEVVKLSDEGFTVDIGFDPERVH